MVFCIVIEPLCGIGSRLRSIASIFSICQEHDKQMILKWLPQNDCKCNFCDLYELPIGVILYDQSVHSTLCKRVVNSYTDLTQSLEDTNYDALELSSSECDGLRDDERFRTFLRLLKPVRRVLSIIHRYQKTISNYVGLHIRVIDSTNDHDSSKQELNDQGIDAQHLRAYRETSSVKNFEKIIDYEIAKNPLVIFFVASNVESTFVKLLAKYGSSKISFINHRCFDRSLESIQYAVADLILLAKTEKVYGSGWSAFTDVVAFLRKDSPSSNEIVYSNDFAKIIRPSLTCSDGYNLFMFIHEQVKVKFDISERHDIATYENRILTHLKTEKKKTFLQEFAFKKKYDFKINYDYYKEFTLSFVKKLIKNFPQHLNERIYVPPYKFILGKPYDFKYGNHRIGWKAVIANLLAANYVESEDFHYENPYFEWFSYAMKNKLNTYNEAVYHFLQTDKTQNDTINILHSPIKAFIIDDWTEFSYTYHIDKKRPYNIDFISFTHDPLHNDFIPLKNDFSNFLKKKLETPVYYHMDLFQTEKENLHTLFTLSTSHLEAVKREEIGGFHTKYDMLYHPIEYCRENCFNFYHFQRSTDRKIYMLGWWMRKYDIFLAMQTLTVTKVIILKDAEGEWVRDYVMYEIRKSLQVSDLNNNEVQSSYTAEEAKYWYESLNLKIQDYLNDSEYDNIFQESIVFLDFYDVSASNVIIECILTSTPLLVCKKRACIDYLGEEYPFYFSSLEEAVTKLNDMELICKSHLYLKKMDKSKFTYAYFNKCVHDSILKRQEKFSLH